MAWEIGALPYLKHWLFLPMCVRVFSLWRLGIARVSQSWEFGMEIMWVGVHVVGIIDRFLDRSIHAITFSSLSVVGLFLLMFLPEDQLGARYFAVCFTSSTSVSNNPWGCSKNGNHCSPLLWNRMQLLQYRWVGHRAACKWLTCTSWVWIRIWLCIIIVARLHVVQWHWPWQEPLAILAAS